MTGPVDARILVVCTANEIRSPMIATVLGTLAGHAGLAWDVGSAGTHARPGRRVHPHTADALAHEGYPSPTRRSYQLEPQDVEAADLILAAAGEHRRYVVTMHPPAMRRCFLFNEFARLLGEATTGALAPPVRIDALLERARLARSAGAPPQPGADDIADPVGKRQRVFDETLSGIIASARVIVDAALGG